MPRTKNVAVTPSSSSRFKIAATWPSNAACGRSQSGCPRLRRAFWFQSSKSKLRTRLRPTSFKTCALAPLFCQQAVAVAEERRPVDQRADLLRRVVALFRDEVVDALGLGQIEAFLARVARLGRGQLDHLTGDHDRHAGALRRGGETCRSNLVHE